MDLIGFAGGGRNISLLTQYSKSCKEQKEYTEKEKIKPGFQYIKVKITQS